MPTGRRLASLDPSALRLLPEAPSSQYFLRLFFLRCLDTTHSPEEGRPRGQPGVCWSGRQGSGETAVVSGPPPGRQWSDHLCSPQGLNYHSVSDSAHSLQRGSCLSQFTAGTPPREVSGPSSTHSPVCWLSCKWAALPTARPGGLSRPGDLWWLGDGTRGPAQRFSGFTPLPLAQS